jgi:hypothetical protein
MATTALSTAFFQGVFAMSERLNALGADISGIDLLAVWYSESGVKNIKNTAGYPYGGFNQMGPDERKAAGYNGSFDDWVAMKGEDQLPYIEKFYLTAARGKASLYRDQVSLYLANAAPGIFIIYGGNLKYVVYGKNSAAYKANTGLDRAGKGFITVEDLGNRIIESTANPINKARWDEITLRYVQEAGDTTNRIAVLYRIPKKLPGLSDTGLKVILEESTR